MWGPKHCKLRSHKELAKSPHVYTNKQHLQQGVRFGSWQGSNLPGCSLLARPLTDVAPPEVYWPWLHGKEQILEIGG